MRSSQEEGFLCGAYTGLQQSVARLQELVCCGPNWLVSPGDDFEFDEDAPLISVPPMGELAEALIPPSMPSYDDRRQSSASEGSRPGWDASALRPLPPEGMAASPRSERLKGVGDGSGKLQGIELKEAAANPLLGQVHLDASGLFVQPTLAKPRTPSSPPPQPTAPRPA